MSESHKQLFAKMEQDKDVRRLSPGDYRLLRNGIPIQGTTANALEAAVNSVYGHALVTNAALEANSVVVGFLEDRVGNRAFFAVYNSNNNHTIYQVTSAFVVSTVLRTSIWGFGSTDYVDMDILGDFLFLTNNTSEPKKINITKAAAGDYGTVTAEKISIIKRGPQFPLMIDRNEDGGVSANYIDPFFFTLTYRYVYEDGDVSVFAPPSVLPFESTIGSNKNRIAYEIASAESQPTTVKQIDFAISINGSNEFSVFKSVTVSAGTKPALAYLYNPGGITVGDSVPLKWTDFVPRKCKSLKVFKNRLFSFSNTEGYGYSQKALTNFTSAANSQLIDPAFTSGGTYLVGLVFFDAYGRIINTRMSQSGSVLIPERVEATLTRYAIAWDVSTVAMADIPTEATHYSIVRTKCMNKSFFLTGKSSDMFYIKRDSAGAITYNKTYSVDNDGVAIDISHFTEYQIGYTLNTGDRIKIYNGTALFDKVIRSQEGRFVIVDNFQLTSIGAGNASRDIIEIYRPKIPSNTENLYEAMDADLTPPYAGASLNPQAGSFSARYAISNPGTGSRAFAVTSGIIGGDATFVSSGGYTDIGRTTDFSYTGYSDTAPYTNVRVTSTLDDILVMNPISQYYDVWLHGVGARVVTVPLVDAQELSKYNVVRYSNPYIQGSDILGLNTFDALDEHYLPIENGVGTLLVEAGDVLVGLHQIESTAIYVGEGFVNTSSGSSFLSKTDSVIGDDRRYMGGHGTTHPASVVARDGRVYFYDSRKGCIVRRSQDGLTRISDYGIIGLVSYLATVHNADSGNSRIVAGWDPQYDCYCISFFLTGGSYNFTLYFHERTNSWVCMTDLMPIRFGILGQYQLAFNTGGGMWKQTPEANYNTFFGTAYSRSITWEIAPFESLIKILEAIEVDSENIYSTAGTNEEIVSVYLERGGTKQTQINYTDFRQREGVWRSPFFNDINDVNFTSALESKFKSPYKVRGQNFYLTLVYNGTDKNRMRSITVFFRPKMLSNP